MSRRLVTRWLARTAVVAAGILAASFAGAAEPVRAVAPPARPPAAAERRVIARTDLSTFARAHGYSHGWIVTDKQLRLKGPRHELIFDVDRREARLDGLRLFMGDAAAAAKRTLAISEIDRDRFLLPILAPQRLATLRPARIIALDAGHGGKDRGTRSDALKLDEKLMTLDLAKRLKPLLEARGFTVYMTRTDDTYIALTERPKLAAAARADLFVSLHFNAAGPAVRGIETYVLTPQHQRSTGSDAYAASDSVAVPGNAHDGWNANLGFVVHRQLVRDLGLPDRGLKHARFVVLRDLGCPGVLIEGGYLSHVDEARLINDSQHRDKLAATIAKALTAFNQQLLDLAATRAKADPRGS